MPESINISLNNTHAECVADAVPELTDRLKVTEKNSRTISFTTNQLETIRVKAESARLHAKKGMNRTLLRQFVDGVTNTRNTTGSWNGQASSIRKNSMLAR